MIIKIKRLVLEPNSRNLNRIIVSETVRRTYMLVLGLVSFRSVRNAEAYNCSLNALWKAEKPNQAKTKLTIVSRGC